MKKNGIIQDPEKILHQISDRVTNLAEARKIAQELIEVTKMVDKSWSIWLGMAAPQIGYKKRVIILRKSHFNYQVMVNPQVLEQKWFFPAFSRCFSLKGVYLIRSHLWIKIRYRDLEGKYHTEIIKGGRAVALESELNHINGVLIPDIGVRLM